MQGYKPAWSVFRSSALEDLHSTVHRGGPCLQISTTWPPTSSCARSAGRPQVFRAAGSGDPPCSAPGLQVLERWWSPALQPSERWELCTPAMHGSRPSRSPDLGAWPRAAKVCRFAGFCKSAGLHAGLQGAASDLQISAHGLQQVCRVLQVCMQVYRAQPAVSSFTARGDL